VCVCVCVVGSLQIHGTSGGGGFFKTKCACLPAFLSSNQARESSAGLLLPGDASFAFRLRRESADEMRGSVASRNHDDRPKDETLRRPARSSETFQAAAADDDECDSERECVCVSIKTGVLCCAVLCCARFVLLIDAVFFPFPRKPDLEANYLVYS